MLYWPMLAPPGLAGDVAVAGAGVREEHVPELLPALAHHHDPLVVPRPGQVLDGPGDRLGRRVESGGGVEGGGGGVEDGGGIMGGGWRCGGWRMEECWLTWNSFLRMCSLLTVSQILTLPDLSAEAM